MRRATLLAILVMLTAACTTRISAGDAPPSTSGSPAVSAAPPTTLDRAVQCVSTDPGRRPISVHRAVHCPDGTVVTVAGVVIGRADGTAALCDSDVAEDCLTIDGITATGLRPAVSGETVYTGAVRGHRLTLPIRP